MAEQITRSIIVKAPVGTLFRLWSGFEDFPKFMPYVKSVSEGHDGLTHWTVEVPGGGRVEWDARVTMLDKNKRIAWNSVRGDIETTGQVLFNGLPGGEAEVTLVFQFVPPGWASGQPGVDLQRQAGERVEEVLRRFKRHAEETAVRERAA